MIMFFDLWRVLICPPGAKLRSSAQRAEKWRNGALQRKKRTHNVISYFIKIAAQV